MIFLNRRLRKELRLLRKELDEHKKELNEFKEWVREETLGIEPNALYLSSPTSTRELVMSLEKDFKMLLKKLGYRIKTVKVKRKIVEEEK